MGCRHPANPLIHLPALCRHLGCTRISQIWHLGLSGGICSCLTASAGMGMKLFRCFDLNQCLMSHPVPFFAPSSVYYEMPSTSGLVRSTAAAYFCMYLTLQRMHRSCTCLLCLQMWMFMTQQILITVRSQVSSPKRREPAISDHLWIFLYLKILFRAGVEPVPAKPNSLERFLPLFLPPSLDPFQYLQQGILQTQPHSYSCLMKMLPQNT